MAINISKYQFSSSSILGKLLPYFLRGRKMYRLLSAVSAPMDTAMKMFESKITEDILDAATTSQTMVMEWSLTERYRKYFDNPNASFRISNHGKYSTRYLYENKAEQPLTYNTYIRQNVDDPAAQIGDDELYVRDPDEEAPNSNDITIYAPKLNDYITEAEYVKYIQRVVDKYLINPYLPYTIVVAGGSSHDIRITE